LVGVLAGIKKAEAKCHENLSPTTGESETSTLGKNGVGDGGLGSVHMNSSGEKKSDSSRTAHPVGKGGKAGAHKAYCPRWSPWGEVM